MEAVQEFFSVQQSVSTFKELTQPQQAAALRKIVAAASAERAEVVQLIQLAVLCK